MTILFKMKSGSHLYGLVTPESDLDYVGVAIESNFEDFINPFKKVDEFDCSIKSKQSNGKNDKDAIDEKYFHLNKFLKLLSQCNPNLTEMLFSFKDCIEYINPMFKSLFIDSPELFINKGLINRFIGYAISQEHKSHIKTKNYDQLNNYKNYLNEILNYRDKLIDHLNDSNNPFNGTYSFKLRKVEHSSTNIETYIDVGDSSFPLSITIKEAINRIDNRLGKGSHRIKDMLIHKYDPKFLSHTVRLLIEGLELMKTGRLTFPLSKENREIVMNIKLGNTPYEDIIPIIEELKLDFKNNEEACSLPKKPNLKEINKRYISFIKSFYKEL